MLPLLLALAALVAPPADPAEPVSVTAKSWGKTLTAWTMAGDGSITFREAVDRPGGDFQNYDEVTRATPPDPARRKWLVDRLAPVRAAAASPPDCGGRIPDLVYGTARWGEGTGALEMRFDAGCQGAEAARLTAILQAADAQVLVWARKAPEASRRPATRE